MCCFIFYPILLKCVFLKTRENANLFSLMSIEFFFKERTQSWWCVFVFLERKKWKHCCMWGKVTSGRWLADVLFFVLWCIFADFHNLIFANDVQLKLYHRTLSSLTLSYCLILDTLEFTCLCVCVWNFFVFDESA